jgi:hypothetical protein
MKDGICPSGLLQRVQPAKQISPIIIINLNRDEFWEFLGTFALPRSFNFPAP